MKRTQRETKKLNKLLNTLERYERNTLPNRGFQLSIEEIIIVFNIKYEEFPVMKKLVSDPNHVSGTNEFMLFRWMAMSVECHNCMELVTK